MQLTRARARSTRAEPRQGRSRAGDGQVLALFAMSLVVLIGFAAVATDLGSWLKVRRDYQNAADGAALAGSPFLAGTPNRAGARLAAWQSLQSQLGVTIPCANPLTPCGDTPAASPVAAGQYRMWVSTPPVGAASVTRARYPGASTGSGDKTIFVWVEAVNPSFLARMFGVNGSLVSAWATAGTYPSDFAVITLRQPGQAGPAQPNINLAGQNVALRVVNGDVGGNYNMRLNSSTDLVLPGDSQVYLYDYVSCGQSCWANIQIHNGAGSLKTALQLPGPVPDPNYPLPPTVTSAPTAPTAALPYGYLKIDPAAADRSTSQNVTISGGADHPQAGPSVIRNGSNPPVCDGTKAVRIGPGYYKDISVTGDYCVVLDPAYRHDCLSVGAVTSGYCVDTPTAVPQNQMPGVFYVNGKIEVGNGAMLVGDGVTIVSRPSTSSTGPQNAINISGGSSGPAIVSLNQGTSPLSVGVAQTSGAWTRVGDRPYNWVTNGCGYAQAACWAYTNAFESNPGHIGIALYVMRRDQIPGLSVSADDWTEIIKVNASAALVWQGITYAPHDYVSLAGQPGYNGVGQLVSWTFKFAGGTDVTQTYSGALGAVPLLIEPKLGQQ